MTDSMPEEPPRSPRNPELEEDSRGRYGDGGYNAGIAVFSYIVGGILVWSLIGWGLDYLLGTRWIVLAGALMGAAGGFYLSHMHNLTRSYSSGPGDTPQAGTGDGPSVTE